MLKGGLKQSQIVDDSSFSRDSNSTNSAPISQDSLGNQKNSKRTSSSKNLKYQEKNPKKPEAQMQNLFPFELLKEKKETKKDNYKVSDKDLVI